VLRRQPCRTTQRSRCLGNWPKASSLNILSDQLLTGKVIFDSFTSLVEDTFCNNKFDGFYDDPNDCTVFYQCLNGKATKRHCLKGMVFNALLKTCDTPKDFPCRTAEGTVAKQIENNMLEVKPSPRIGMNNLDSGRYWHVCLTWENEEKNWAFSKWINGK